MNRATPVTLTKLVAVILLFFSGTALAIPQLNGLAVSKELNEDRFIAALYSETPWKDANSMLSAQEPLSMELKVLASRLSARNIQGMWIEGIAINNSGDVLEQQSDNIGKLSNMVRKRLRRGDILRYDFTPGDGIKASLNGVEIGRINSDEFFPIMLRTWIGSVPLSSDFKRSLLAAGDVDGDLNRTYRELEPSQARVDEVAEQQQQRAQDNVAEVTAEPAVPSPAKPQLVVEKPIIQLTPDAIQAFQEKPQQVAEALPKPAPTPAPAPAPAKPPTPEPKPAPKPQEVAVLDPRPAPAPAPKPQPKPPVVEEDDEDELEEISVATILARQNYVQNLRKHISDFQRYPKRALEKGWEGTVRLSITLDREGELIDAVVLDESRFSLLDREAMRSAERASPYPDIPSAIPGDNFSFSLPIQYVMTRED